MGRSEKKEKKKEPSGLELKLKELENQLLQKGIQVHYERLEAAGLKLKGGICKVKGAPHLFIDKREPISEKVRILKEYLANPFNELPKGPYINSLSNTDNISEAS